MGHVSLSRAQAPSEGGGELCGNALSVSSRYGALSDSVFCQKDTVSLVAAAGTKQVIGTHEGVLRAGDIALKG